MLPEHWICGWDVGGAHLKFALADDRGGLQRVGTYYTPLWQGLDHLDRAIAEVVATLPEGTVAHRITMTGELVDLFDDRARGVEALSSRMAASLPVGSVRVFAGPEGFVAPSLAREHWARIASANWFATASLVARSLDQALLVDIGSTTTDLVPIVDGRVRARGYSDRERLALQELIYTGVVRTPVMALTTRVPLGGDWIGLTAEHFATTADVYRLTGELAEQADLGDTADGRGKTEKDSAARLARMVGEDACRQEPAVWRQLARYLRDCQLGQLGDALARQCSLDLTDDAPLVGVGVGRFLVEQAAARIGRPYLTLSDLVHGDEACAVEDAAECAPAAAVALLAAGANGVDGIHHADRD
ncbi:MAG: hydantoinase/oxoprolinase family protein [Thiohalocapsa sp.]